MPEPKIVILTGARQVGKSTLCSNLAVDLQTKGIKTSGIITQRTGPDALTLVELQTQHTYPLTTANPDAGIPVGHFVMDPTALERGNQALEASFPTQIFILDEIGPLELRQRHGWIRAITLLRTQSYDLAFVVVRPELLISAIWQLPASFYIVVTVTLQNRDILENSLMSMSKEACATSESEEQN